MNFNSITSLLANDISPDEIVAQLEKHGPALSRKIKQMLLGGYGSSEILKFISKDKSTQKEIKNFKGKPTTPYEIARVAEMQNAMEVPKGRDQQALEELKRATPYVLGAFAATLPVVAPELGLAGQLPGMISGYIQEWLGYQHFFVWVVIATLPSFIVIKFIQIDPEFGKKAHS